MDYTILQGTMFLRQIKIYHKYRYDSLKEALEVFDKIKDNQTEYSLRFGKCVLTMIIDSDNKVIKYHKSYRRK